MKLIVQIPCHNEERTLPLTLKDIPRSISGINSVEILVINDGSTDRTREVAQEHGVEHIVDLPYKRGLAEAFRKGLDTSARLGADIIVNTDGDNQYRGEDIKKLVKPIVDNRADIVIGCRDISAIEHFSFIKKSLQRFGSYIVRKFSRTDIPDTTSGFRAYSLEAALKLNIFSTYTYTLETIIQAGRKEIPMTYVQIGTNEKLRESRLIKSIPAYIMRSIATILRVYLMYEPMSVFVRIGGVLFGSGLLLSLRYLYFFLFAARKGGHIQSLLLSAILILMGFICATAGLLADVIAANRRLNEEVLFKMKILELKKNR
jgi:glycosyltransferase involved in cell wall biosynthesis